MSEMSELDDMTRERVEQDLKDHPDYIWMQDLVRVMMTHQGRRFIFGLIERSGLFTPMASNGEGANFWQGRMFTGQEIIGNLRSTQSGTSLLNTMFGENLRGADVSQT